MPNTVACSALGLAAPTRLSPYSSRGLFLGLSFGPLILVDAAMTRAAHRDDVCQKLTTEMAIAKMMELKHLGIVWAFADVAVCWKAAGQIALLEGLPRL